MFSLALLALLPAIAEEFFFRGVLQRLLTQLVRNGWLAVFITAVFFSAIHMQFLGFVPRVVLGFVMGAIYYLSGNLWLSIAGHFPQQRPAGSAVVPLPGKSDHLRRDEGRAYAFLLRPDQPARGGFLLMVLQRRAKAAGQTFALPEEPEEEEDQDSIFKDLIYGKRLGKSFLPVTYPTKQRSSGACCWKTK